MPDHRPDPDAADAAGARRVAPLPSAQAPEPEPEKFAQYGMRAPAANVAHHNAPPSGATLQTGAVPSESGHGGSNYGAPTDHQSFDAEYRVREERDERERSIPTDVPAATPPPQ